MKPSIVDLQERIVELEREIKQREIEQRDREIKMISDVLTSVDKTMAENSQPVAWREVSCGDDGTCCYTYNEMGIGEPLFAATYKENEDE